MLSRRKHRKRSTPVAVSAPTPAKDAFATLRQHVEPVVAIRPESVSVHYCPNSSQSNQCARLGTRKVACGAISGAVITVRRKTPTGGALGAALGRRECH